MNHLYRPGYNYQKAGAVLSELTSRTMSQTGLFGDVDKPRGQLMAAIDTINSRMGRATIRSAGEGIRQPWKMRSAYKSRNFTTCWNEILVVPG